LELAAARLKYKKPAATGFRAVSPVRVITGSAAGVQLERAVRSSAVEP